jgi:hypothetical protein
MLRDYMLYAGIRTSRRFCRLSWFQRDLFVGLLHACDDYGRFEADAEKLWAVLYALDRARVSKRDVQEGLLRFTAADIGLVRFYTVRGVGYGKVHNFRQNGLKKRRALYPDEDGSEPELFTGPPVETVSGRKERRKSPHSPPPAGGEDTPLTQTKPRQPARFRRAVRLDTLNDERERLEDEMRAILRPGGCAYAVEPTQPEKQKRLAALRQAHAELCELITRRRAELAKEGAA